MIWYLRSKTGKLEYKWLGTGDYIYIGGYDFDGDGRTDHAKYFSDTHILSWLDIATNSWTDIFMGGEELDIVYLQ
jgi:hypothetical protein